MLPKAIPLSLALAMLVRDQVLSLLSELKFLQKKKKKRPKSRRGNYLVLPHASYGPGLWFNQLSVPASWSNMNNVHNTFSVAALIYNVVQHFLSQLKTTILSLPLAFNSSNALEYSN